MENYWTEHNYERCEPVNEINEVAIITRGLIK
jgi:hypothetical protein